MAHLEITPFRADTNNADVLNAIRNVSSSDYQRRIPEATKANLQETAKALLSNGPLRNEFVSALMNRIGLVIARNSSWSNPYAKFKRGMLEWGDTIEEIQVGLAEAYAYDTDRDYLERAIFGQERPDVQSSFHKINRQNFYKITVNDAILRRAFLESSGLAGFVSTLMEVPNTSDQWDEFNIMCQMFREYDDNGGFFYVNTPDISASGSTAAEAKTFLREVRRFADTLPFLSTHYNAAGMPVAASRDDLELFITPEANAAIDVEALAAAFQIDRANVPTRTTIIPKEKFNIPGAQAVLTTKDFFVVADSLYEMRQSQNPVGLYDNFFLHHHQVVSTSRFVPALLFTTAAGTVIEIEDTPVTSVAALEVQDSHGNVVTDVQRGSLNFVVGSAVTTPEGGYNDAVVLSISGDVALSSLTYMSQTGTLHVGPDEAATVITITETATDDNEFTATVDVTVVGDLLTLWPNPSVKLDSDNDGIFDEDEV